ncbi:ADP-ribosylglycohydrolase family protein [Pseudomonas sp. 65/3-MNA-CIBAN-0223]|uniref:ADP-ribosylglycohydrolase family protein n=1 Tax=Pseudomonas sp. 65/3-MNA-CIBAN-0223 TaxID=3140476 RepID=UPI0033196814
MPKWQLADYADYLEQVLRRFDVFVSSAEQPVSADSFEQSVINAVNHTGDSDSTGLIAGHLLGIQYRPAAITARWYEQLGMRDVVERVSKDIERVPRDFCGCGGKFDQLGNCFDVKLSLELLD